MSKILDPTAKAYKKVRDATLCNEELSYAEKIAILNVILHECISEFDLSLITLHKSH